MSGETGRVFVISNPASGGGRGAKRISRYLELLRRAYPDLTHRATSTAGEEAALAEEAIRQGCQTLIAVGGDGTWSAVADRILSLDRADVRMGLLPGGTGNDFGRNIGIPGKDLDEAVAALVRGHVWRTDVGLIVGGSRHEERESSPRERRFFLNVVGFGFDVATVDEAKGARFLRGEILYKVAALKQLFRYPGLHVALEWGGGDRIAAPTLMLTITNGTHFGGGFPIAPGASVLDGNLHACHFRDVGPLRRLRLFDQAGKGRHLASPWVTTAASRRFDLTFPAPPRFEVDGDLYVASGNRISVEVRQASLQVLAPSR